MGEGGVVGFFFYFSLADKMDFHFSDMLVTGFYQWETHLLSRWLFAALSGLL